MKLQDLYKQRAESLTKADSILRAAEETNRQLTTSEQESVDATTKDLDALNAQIASAEKVNSIRSMVNNGQMLTDGPARKARKGLPAWQCIEYRDAVETFLESRGTIVPDAFKLGYDGSGFVFPALRGANYEGGANNGAIVYQTAPVDTQVIPLAPIELGVESIARKVPTSMDIPMSRKKQHGVANMKAEGDGTGSNVFTGTSPQLEKFTLSAYMLGHPEDISWELAQDVGMFQSFLQDDIGYSCAVLKDTKFLTGSGSGEPQGLIGNTGAGVTGVLVGSDNYASELFDAVLNVLGDLNAVYHNNAKFLLSRATSIVIRSQQRKANLYEPVWVRQGATDYLYGYPVVYSSAMPAIAASATPVLFGDFEAGYIIGYRGGNGLNVKILDQPKALEGLLTIIGYQRVDGRVRRSEAIQAITLHS